MLVLVVDVAVVPEELDVELVVEVPEGDVLLLEAELRLLRMMLCWKMPLKAAA